LDAEILGFFKAQGAGYQSRMNAALRAAMERNLEVRQRVSALRFDCGLPHLQQEPFSAWEAAEYLEVSVPTLRRYVQSGKLVPSHVVGRNQMFSAQTLRAFKRTRN
jgi:excisionase family DNA binding protein